MFVASAQGSSIQHVGQRRLSIHTGSVDKRCVSSRSKMTLSRHSPGDFRFRSPPGAKEPNVTRPRLTRAKLSKKFLLRAEM
jgi:hypothetical protein